MSPAELVAIVALAVFGVAPLALRAALRRRRAHARMAFWRESAREAGITDVVRWGDGVTGSAGPLQVHLSSFQERDEVGTRLEITGPRLAPGLALRPEAPRGLLGHRNTKEIEVGDTGFDALVSVQGPPALALSLLDADLRRTLSLLVRGFLAVRGHRPLWASGRLEDGVLRVDVPQQSPVARGTLAERRERHDRAGETYLDGEYRLPQVLRAALDLAARLAVPEDVARRIASRLAEEPEPRVRGQALQTLLREFPEHEATRQALVAARDDEDAELRVRAGIALGAEGRDVLLGVAGGEGAEDATSARAVAALADSLTNEKAAELLRNALRTRRVATAGVCLGVLGRHGSDATAVLAKVLLVEKGELGEAAAQALAATGDPAAEAPLLRALAEGTPELRRAAVAALGRVGTRDAVAALREAESHDAALRGVARQAVAEIQSRLAGAAKGQLSLAGGESGRLSIAEDEAGRLSLSDSEQNAAAKLEPPARGAGASGPEQAH
jgi:HEAT repeat protein